MRGYKEINYRAMKLLPRGGYLATASCSHFATEELFIKMLRAAAKDAHRQLRQIEVKQQAPDHPILWGVPETNYLKFFLFQVIKSNTKYDISQKNENVFVQNRQFCQLPFRAVPGYNQTIDSNGAVGHLLTRSAVFVKKLFAVSGPQSRRRQFRK